MLEMQPKYPLVRYGIQKTLAKLPGSSDWIKHYLKDIDTLASMVQALIVGLIVMQGSDNGGYKKKQPLNEVIQEALGSRWSSTESV